MCCSFVCVDGANMAMDTTHMYTHNGIHRQHVKTRTTAHSPALKNIP